jgi:copper/silver efflux system protein
LIWLYRPIIKAVLGAKTLTILLALAVVGVTAWPTGRIGSEFMPTLNKGTLFYMPTTLPGISVTKAADLLQMQDRIIKSFPEVESVFGKAGRASTATDPAPTEMYETVINLKPKDQWRAGMTIDSLIAEMDRALQFPGVSNAWTMPIKARIDMLSTGIRTPVGVKVFGTDLGEMEKVARQIEQVLKTIPGHLERLRRARDRRLLPQHRCEPRCARPLRPDGGRRAGDCCNGAGGSGDHHHR